MTQNLKPWNPHEIEAPGHLSINEDAVTEVLEKFSTSGNIPDIIISESGHLIDGIDALEAAKRLDQQMVMVVIQTKPPESLLTSINAELLYTHPLNASIYGENEDLSALKEAISQTGWIKPLVATPDGQGRYRIISGNSCFKVGCELGTTEFNVELKIFASEQEELKTLLAGNVGREKTIEQKVREGLLWEKIEREESKSRQGKSGLGAGATRDIIAKKVGLGSGVNYEHAVAAVKVMDSEPDSVKRSQLKMALSKPKGVDAAYKLIKPQQELKGKQKPPSRWIPKEFERVTITGGMHKDKEATVAFLTGICAVVHVDGTPEAKRDQIPFNQMEPLKAAPTSVTQELKQKQKDLGLGTREQIFPEAPRNEGDPQDLLQPPTISIASDAVEEAAATLLKLSPKQMYEVMNRIEPELDTARLNAIWKALEKSLAHKAA